MPLIAMQPFEGTNGTAIGGDSSTTKRAMNVFSRSGINLTDVEIWLKKQTGESPSETITVGLYETGYLTLPVGSALASDTMSASSLTESFVKYNFDIEYTLLPNRFYAIVIEYPADTDPIVAGYETLESSAFGGRACYYQTSWNNDNTMLGMILYGTVTGVQWWECHQSFTPSSTGWQEEEMEQYGVPKGAVALVVCCNANESAARTVGVRTDGGSLSRYVTTHEAEGGGETTVSMFVKVDESTGKIEAYCDVTADVTFRIVGYFLGTDFTEMYENGTSSISDWQNWDVYTDHSIPKGSVIQVYCWSDDPDSDVYRGVRADGSSFDRRIQIDEAEGGVTAKNGFSMCVKSDPTTGYIEVYHGSDTHHILGYFDNTMDYQEHWGYDENFVDGKNDDLWRQSFPYAYGGAFDYYPDNPLHEVYLYTHPLYTGVRSREGNRFESYTGTIKSAAFVLSKVGSPTGTLYCRIRNSSTDAIIATSATTINVSTDLQVQTAKLCAFDFDETFSGDDIRVCVEFVGGDSSNYVQAYYWAADVIANTYHTSYISSWTDSSSTDSYIFVHSDTIQSGATLAAIDFAMVHQDSGSPTNCGSSIYQYGSRYISEHEAEGGSFTGFQMPASVIEEIGLFLYCGDCSESMFYFSGVFFGVSGVTPVEKTFNIDALFKKLGLTDTFDIDVAIRKKDIQKTFGIDTIISPGFTSYVKSFDIDTLLQTLDITKTADVDTLFKKLNIEDSFAIDTVLKKYDVTKSTDIDTLFKKLDITKSADIDTFFKKLDITSTFDIDTMLKKLDIVKSFDIDNIFVKSYIETISIDAVLKALGVIKSADIDTLFKKLGIESSFLVDALFKKLDITKTADIDTLLQKLDLTDQFSIDAIFKKVYTSTFDLDVVLKKSDIVKSMDIDVIFTSGFIKQFDVDTVLKKLGVIKSFDIDTIIKAIYTKTFDVDAVLKAEDVIKSFSVDTLFAKLDLLKSFDIDTRLLKQDIIKSFNIDVSIGAVTTYIVDFEIDVALKKLGVIKQFSVDTLLLTSFSDSFDIDTALQKLDIEKSIDIDTFFKKLDIEKTADIDTVFKKLDIEKSFDIDLIIIKSYVKSADIDTVFKKLGIEMTMSIDTMFKKLDAIQSFNADVIFKRISTKSLLIDTYLLSVPVVTTQAATDIGWD